MVGDERHLVFECSTVQHVRDKYPGLFSGPGQTMQQFMWQADIAGVVHFVRDSMLVLLSELDDEGRGGTNDGPSNQP